MKQPPFLQPGDTIGILCPSGHMDAGRAVRCMDSLREWGFVVHPGPTLGHGDQYFSGTDDERLGDLQQQLDDPGIKAILCARGGYGLSRIIDRLDFTRFSAHPKWVIGYSDVTVLHAHLYSVLHTPSLHSPMAGAFNDGLDKGPYVTSLRNAITGVKARYHSPANPGNRFGTATATLVGGNLSILSHLVGSRSDVDTRGCLLFLEDVGEYYYRVDRMLVQLARAGKLDGLAGLILGDFSDMKDTLRPFGQSVRQMVLDKVRDYTFPVCFGFPVGHGPENYALKVGVPHILTVDEGGATLAEC